MAWKWTVEVLNQEGQNPKLDRAMCCYRGTALGHWIDHSGKGLFWKRPLWGCQDPTMTDAIIIMVNNKLGWQHYEI